MTASIEQSSERYNLDRKAASKLLRISLRTVDRYIKEKKLSTRVVNGRVWLDKEELGRFKWLKVPVSTVDNVDMSTPHLSIDNDVDNVDKNFTSNVDNVDTPDEENVYSTSTRKKDVYIEEKIYKNLYVELKDELREKQERLEIANYRVGQLEAQVRNSVPLLEYHRESYSKKKQEKEFKNKITEQGTMIKKLFNQLRSEKFNKRIFLIILLTILALQPLWLLMLYK